MEHFTQRMEKEGLLGVFPQKLKTQVTSINLYSRKWPNKAEIYRELVTCVFNFRGTSPSNPPFFHTINKVV